MQQIRIDFDNPGLPQSLGVVEGESQSRIFQAALYKSGAAYTAPAGAVYSIMYRGFGPQNQGWYDTIEDGAGKRAACTVSSNVVTCELARQALRVPGHLTVVLCVSDAKGYMLKSWPIMADVRNDGYEDTVEVESFFYITQITSAEWTKAFAAWEDFKATIDPTLTLSGKAADAKETGDKIGELKEDIDDVSDEIVRDNLIKPANIETGYFSVSDSKLKKETSSSYCRIENIKIPLVNDGKVYIRTEGYSKIFFQNLDKTVVSSTTLKADHTIVQNVEIPENAVFLSMFWQQVVLAEIGMVFVSTTKSETKNFFYENFSMPNYDFSENVDNTLSISGKAADAKAVGDAIKSIFDGKIMLFAGDSICYGANWRPTPDDYSTTGWRKLVQEKYPTAKTYGYGVGGTTIAIRTNRTDSIYERLTKMYSEHSDADYVILQGGVNDCWGKVPLGEITKNYNKELDTSTFCGAMEQMLKDAILKWKGKKIGFICTYKVRDADTIINGGEIVWDFKSYMDKAKEICNKWSVPYCDLYNDSGLCLKLDDIANTYSDGGTHVNELGYRIIFPKIDSWLKTL